MPYEIPNFNHSPHRIPDATDTDAGVMSPADKRKLAGVGIVHWTYDKSWTDVYAEIVACSGNAVVYVYNNPATNVDPNGAPLHVTAGAYDLTKVQFVGVPQGEFGFAIIEFDAGATIDAHGIMNLNLTNVQPNVNGPICSPLCVVNIYLTGSTVTRKIDATVIPQASNLFMKLDTGRFTNAAGLVTTTAFLDAAPNAIPVMQARNSSSCDINIYGGDATVTWALLYSSDSAAVGATNTLLVASGAALSPAVLAVSGVMLKGSTFSSLPTADANNKRALKYDNTNNRPVYSDGGKWVATGVITGTLAARPTAGVNFRGMYYAVQAANGFADTFYVCLKSAGDTYSWVLLGTG